MRILAGPDLHIRHIPPEKRIDSFYETHKTKTRYMLNTAVDERCEVVILPGDVTDTPRLPYWVTREYTSMFKEYAEWFTIFVVPGQHDLMYHAIKYNTPLWMMDTAGALEIVEGQSVLLGEGVRLWGAGWGEELPEVPRYRGLKILVTHRMFAADKKIWEGQEDVLFSDPFLRMNKWDLVISGDNHERFARGLEGRYHVNCGSLMRQKIDQVHHLPYFYIFDTTDKSLTAYQIPCEPIESVMLVEEAKQEKERNEELEAFVEKVREKTEIEGLDFVDNLAERLKQDDITDDIRDFGEEVIRDAAEKLGG